MTDGTLVTNPLKRGWEWLAVEPHQRIGVRILQVAIGLMLLFRVLTECRFYLYLWGPNGIGTGHTSRILGDTLGGVLDQLFQSGAGTLAILLLLAVSAALLVFGRWTRLATLFALITFVSIEQRLPQLPDGGDNIARIVLVYMLFLLPPRANVKPGSLRVWFHNLAVLAIATQLIILYTTSGFMKAFGDKWHHGVAMYYVSQVEWFSLPALRQMFMRPLIVTLSTYIPMFYQLLFGVAILSPLKVPWLLVGICFHLGVASFMGLVSFSTAMIGLECFLISDAEYRRMAKLVGRLYEQILCFTQGFTRRPPVSARPQPVYLIQSEIESPRSLDSR